MSGFHSTPEVSGGAAEQPLIAMSRPFMRPVPREISSCRLSNGGRAMSDMREWLIEPGLDQDADRFGAVTVGLELLAEPDLETVIGPVERSIT